MNSYQSVWEDDETNRNVELIVSYSLEAAQVAIHDITPTLISFRDAASKEVTRSIGVWTKAGKDLLVRQLSAAGIVEQLQQEITTTHLATA